MATAKQRRLQSKMLPLCVNTTDWDIAKLEWRLDHVERKDNKCVCGQSIMDNCHMKNIETGCEELVIVGSCCVKQFINTEIGKTGGTLIKAITEFEKNPTTRVGQAELIKFSKEHEILSAREERFLGHLGMKRESTMKEAEKNELIAINKKMIACVQGLKVEEEIIPVVVEEKRVLIDVEKVMLVRSQGIINDWEVKFLLDVNNKLEKSMSEKQLNRISIVMNKIK